MRSASARKLSHLVASGRKEFRPLVPKPVSECVMDESHVPELVVHPDPFNHSPFGTAASRMVSHLEVTNDVRRTIATGS